MVFSALILPSNGFAPHTPCTDNDAVVPPLAAALGVEVSTCAEVRAQDYCSNVPQEYRHYCCASCSGIDLVGGVLPNPAKGDDNEGY